MNFFYGSQLNDLPAGTMLAEVAEVVNRNGHHTYVLGRPILHRGNQPSLDPKLVDQARLSYFPGYAVVESAFRQSVKPHTIVPPMDKTQYLVINRSCMHDMLESFLEMVRTAGVGEKTVRKIVDRIYEVPDVVEHKPLPMHQLDEVTSHTIKFQSGPTRRFQLKNYRVIKVLDFSQEEDESIIWRVLGVGQRGDPRWLVPCPRSIKRFDLLRAIAQNGMEAFVKDYPGAILMPHIRDNMPETHQCEEPGLYVSYHHGSTSMGRGFIVHKPKTK